MKTAKFIKLLRLRWYGHVERMQNQRMLKQIPASTTTEGIRKRGRSHKRRRHETEEDLNGGEKIARQWSETTGKWRNTPVEATVHSGM
jgi:hypothetical protein